MLPSARESAGIRRVRGDELETAVETRSDPEVRNAEAFAVRIHGYGAQEVNRGMASLDDVDGLTANPSILHVFRGSLSVWFREIQGVPQGCGTVAARDWAIRVSIYR